MAGLFDVGQGMARYRPPSALAGPYARNRVSDSRPGDDPSSWQTTVTPDQSPTPPPEGLLDSFGDGFSNALSNPLFQFGMGMMGAGSAGKGLGGGLFAGAEQAGDAFKMQKQQRELQMQKQRDAFIQGLDDPNSPIARNFSPETVATLKGLPPDQSAGLLAQLLSRKGDLAQAKSIAQINADATVRAKIQELDYQRRMAVEAMNQFGGAGAQAKPAPLTDGVYRYVPGVGLQGGQ